MLRERMLKLSINGVQRILSAHKFNWFSNYTTVASKASEIPISMVDYLVNSLGFSKDEASVTSSKVCTFKSAENPNSVIDFFKISGFSQSQIKQLVSKEPRILSSNVDKAIKPKIQGLHDLGFSKSDLAHFISFNPSICTRSSSDHIIRSLEFLKSIIGDDNEVLIKAVRNSPRLLGPWVKKELPDVVSLLKSFGLSDHQIKLVVLRRAWNLSFGIKLVEAMLIRVENLGIRRGSGMFFHGICALCSFNEASLAARKRIYKSYGFNDANVSTLARKSPSALTVSDSKLKNCLDFFMKEAGCLPSEIALYADVLTLSLEKRVIPRYRVWKVLKEKRIKLVTNKKIKNVNVFFFNGLRISEPRFFERFVQPFKVECPDLYGDYVKVARPALF